jgi:hypothetical protein
MAGFDNFHIGAGELEVNSQDVGHTTPEGVVVTVEPNVHLHQSGKWGTTPVKASILGYEVTVQITMAETTLENLNRAIAGSTTGGNNTEIGGTSGREVTGNEIVLTPYDGTESWTFRNAVPTSPVEVLYQVENERVYQVTFTALVDEDSPEDSNVVFVS